MIIPLTAIPSPILFKKAVPIKKIDQGIINLIKDMLDTFKIQEHPKAIGLAANQIGRSEKIFLALIDKKIVPFINPEIIEISNELQKPDKKNDIPLEGCLSIPGYFGEVKRPKWVKVKYQTISSFGAANVFSARSYRIPSSSEGRDPAGRRGCEHCKKMFANQNEIVTKTETFSGFPAAIICHEMDHLEGRLFTEKLLSQNGKLYQVITAKNGKEEFEEVKIPPKP